MPLVDVSGVIHFATDACESLFGISAPALENKPFASALQATDQQSFSQFLHDRINPMAGQFFARLGPLDFGIKLEGGERRESSNWGALRVGSVDMLQLAAVQAFLFFSA